MPNPVCVILILVGTVIMFSYNIVSTLNSRHEAAVMNACVAIGIEYSKSLPEASRPGYEKILETCRVSASDR